MDKELFVQEIETCLGLMYRVAFTILRNEEDCKDALQEAILKAWEKRHTLKDMRSFKTWIIVIVKNSCYNILRKRKRIVSIEVIQEPSFPAPDPTLALALQSLPEKYRLPLVLSCSEGLTYREISEVLHLPTTTVCGRIRMAKELLRKELSFE